MYIFITLFKKALVAFMLFVNSGQHEGTSCVLYMSVIIQHVLNQHEV
jgi:hypothetical protein